MPGWERLQWTRYGIAAVLLAAIFRAALEPFLGERAAYLPFALSIHATILFCGSFFAVWATGMSLAFGWYFADPEMFNPAHLVEAATLLLAAAGTFALRRLINRARRRAAVSDATADARSRDAIKVIEELNLLINGAQGHAIYMLDLVGHVTIGNEETVRLNRRREAEILGKHTSLFFPAAAHAADRSEADLARARAEGRLEQESWGMRKDGREFPASIPITTFLDEVGGLRGFAKIVSDITEKRAAENNIRARESHLLSILSTVPDAMAMIDEHNAFLSFSAADQAPFGHTEDEIVGSNVNMLMPSPGRERHDGYLDRYLTTGEKRIVGKERVVYAARKDERSLPVQLSIAEAQAGQQRIFTGFLRDLTECRHTEERLGDLQSELIHVLRVSAMGSMASTLVHEINQPIGTIANYFEALCDRLVDLGSREPPKLIEALDDAAKAALPAGDIVRGLREFVARGEVARTVERPVLINDASVLGLIGARERGIEARFDLDPYMSPMFVNRVQVQQVLINLICNACEAMKDQVKHHLTVTSRLDRPAFGQISAAETGPRVASEIADKLFTASLSTKQDGMGLGLSICRTIIEVIDGRIWMETRDGRGTCFHFTLPPAEMEDESG